MHRFYADAPFAPGDRVPLTPEDAAHAERVLRLRPGAEVELLGFGLRCRGILAEGPDGQLAVETSAPLPSTEPRLRVTLYQGLPKADKMEWIVQKAVELGVHRIVPVSMSRCVVRLDAKDGAKKQLRWQKIAREAGKQSGRCEIPEVEAPLPFAALAERVGSHERFLIPWEEAGGYSLTAFRREHPEAENIGVLIGPEGGIAPEEIGQLRPAGALPVTLGPRILRTETAGLAALSALYALYGDMD